MDTTKSAAADHRGADHAADAIAHNIERTVERTALRKVRNLVEEIQREDAHRRSVQKHVVAAALTCVLAFFALQAWQKTQQQKADRAREAIYACEYRASLEEMPRVKDELLREQPGIAAAEFRAELRTRQAAVWAKVRRQCMTAGAPDA